MRSSIRASKVAGLGLGLAVVATAPVLDARGAPMEPAAAPRWQVDLGQDPAWVYVSGGSVSIATSGRVTVFDRAAGAQRSAVEIPGLSGLRPAAGSTAFAPAALPEAPGPHGLVGQALEGVFALAPDVATLRWRLDGKRPKVMAEREGLVVILYDSEPTAGVAAGLSDPARTEVVAVEAATGQVRWGATAPEVTRKWMSALVDQTGVYVLSYDGLATALELKDGRQRWHRRLAAEAGSAVQDARLIAGHLLLAGVAAVWAVDCRSGDELWRRAARYPKIEPVGADHAVVMASAGEVAVLAASTGQARVTHRVAAASSLERAGPYLLVQGDELLVLDEATGEERRRYPVASHTAVTAAGSRLFLLTARRATAPPALVGLDVATGTSWQSVRRFGGASPLIIAGDVVAACTDAGVVHGLDVTTGAALWRVSLGRLGAAGTVIPCRLFPADASAMLAQGSGSRVYLLAAHPTPASVRPIAVSVRVTGPGRRARIRVHIGEAWRTTDETGVVTAAVRAAAVITVQLDPRSLPRCMSAAPVQLDAARTRSASVVLRYGKDYCACHPCD